MKRKSQILLDENGYIKEYALIGQIEGGQDFDQFPDDLDDFENNYQSYKIINGLLYKNQDKAEEIELEKKKNNLRNKRKIECFDYINRGALWYNRLSKNQKEELEQWYDNWLNVTDTLLIPEKPSWLKD